MNRKILKKCINNNSKYNKTMNGETIQFVFVLILFQSILDYFRLFY